MGPGAVRRNGSTVLLVVAVVLAAVISIAVLAEGSPLTRLADRTGFDLALAGPVDGTSVGEQVLHPLVSRDYSDWAALAQSTSDYRSAVVEPPPGSVARFREGSDRRADGSTTPTFVGAIRTPSPDVAAALAQAYGQPPGSCLGAGAAVRCVETRIRGRVVYLGVGTGATVDLATAAATDLVVRQAEAVTQAEVIQLSTRLALVLGSLLGAGELVTLVVLARARRLRRARLTGPIAGIEPTRLHPAPSPPSWEIGDLALRTRLLILRRLATSLIWAVAVVGTVVRPDLWPFFALCALIPRVVTNGSLTLTQAALGCYQLVLAALVLVPPWLVATVVYPRFGVIAGAVAGVTTAVALGAAAFVGLGPQRRQRLRDRALRSAAWDVIRARPTWLRARPANDPAVLAGYLGGLVSIAAAVVGSPVALQACAVGCAGVSLTSASARARRSIVERALTAAEARALDPRPPVLWLRTFQDDELLMRAERSGRLTGAQRLGLIRWERYEELICEELWRAGPVLALQAPGRELRPVGAAKLDLGPDALTLAPDGQLGWQREVRKLMEEAALVVVSVGATPGLVEEIDHLLSTPELRSRTWFVFPPVDADEQRARARSLLTDATGSSSDVIAAAAVFDEMADRRLRPVIAVQLNEEAARILVAPARSARAYQALALELAGPQGDRYPHLARALRWFNRKTRTVPLFGLREVELAFSPVPAEPTTLVAAAARHLQAERPRTDRRHITMGAVFAALVTNLGLHLLWPDAVHPPWFWDGLALACGLWAWRSRSELLWAVCALLALLSGLWFGFNVYVPAWGHWTTVAVGLVPAALVARVFGLTALLAPLRWAWRFVWGRVRLSFSLYRLLFVGVFRLGRRVYRAVPRR